MRILYITAYLPLFGSHGFASKTFDDIELLSLKHTVNIISFVSKQDKEKINYQNKINCKIYPFFVNDYLHLPYKCQEMTNLVRDFIERGQVDILQCELSFMTRYLPKFNDITSILTEHIIFPLYFWRHFKVRKNPLMLLRIIKNILNEKNWLSKYKRIIFFSEHDKNIIDFLIRDKLKIRIIPMGINADYFCPYKKNNQKYDACFLGSFLNCPNIDALFYFIHRIFPLIKKTFPKFSLLIIGNNPLKKIERLNGRDDISVIGDVEDVRPYLSMSKIFINPIRLGSGMRRKLLEAWAMAKPVISSSVGCEGFNIKNKKNILIADNHVDFAKQVKLLMENEELRLGLGKEGRITVEKYYDRENSIVSLERVYQELIS